MKKTKTAKKISVDVSIYSFSDDLVYKKTVSCTNTAQLQIIANSIRKKQEKAKGIENCYISYGMIF